MAENSWPFYGQETNETQFSKWARALTASGVVSGLAVTAAAGMNVSVGVGSALVRGVYYENTSAVQKPVNAAPASGSRRDALVLRLDQNANTITALVLAGSASALPALTQTESVYDVFLREIRVPAGAVSITSAMILGAAPSASIPVVQYATDADRPTLSDFPVALGVNTAAKRVDLWLAGSWSSLFSLDNMSGTLPVTKGGTGGNTEIAALNGLGLFPQAAQPAVAPAGKTRIWFKTGA